MNPIPAIYLDAVGYTYNPGRRNENVIFSGMNLTIWPGEVVGVVGPSGSGKTTLLGVASTLLRPTVGKVYLAGERTDGMSGGHLTRLRRQRCGLITQTGDLDPYLSAVENVMYLPRLLGKHCVRAKAKELLARVGLDDGRVQRARVRDLSGGERQRVAIARALATEPEVIFADEPTSALDHKNKDLVMRTMLGSKSAETAVMVASHDIDVMRAYCHRIIKMHDGVIETEDLSILSKL